MGALVAVFRLLTRLLASGRGVTAYGLCLLVSLIFLRSDILEKHSIVHGVLVTTLYPVQLLVSQVTRIEDISVANRELREENAALALKLSRVQEAEAENERLHQMIGYQPVDTSRVLLARVIGRGVEAGRFDNAIIIDRGLRDSVVPFMPMSTTHGLVGRVSRVFYDHAVVRLIGDPVMKVSVIETRTRTTGILESPDGRQVHVVMTAHAGVQEGDTLVTSGFGGVFPKGLPVGVVTGEGPGEIAVLRHFAIKPFQDLAHLEDVFVILKSPDWVLRFQEAAL